MLRRRCFIGGLLAAPAIIRTPGLLMAVKPARMERIYPDFVYIGSHGGTVGAVLYFRDLTIHSPIEITLIRENGLWCGVPVSG